jgi:hypothetical protein
MFPELGTETAHFADDWQGGGHRRRRSEGEVLVQLAELEAD